MNMSERMKDVIRRAPTLIGGMVLGMLVSIPFGAMVRSQTQASDVRVVNSDMDAVYVRFPNADDGRKVVVSNTQDKPAFIKPVGTLNVATGLDDNLKGIRNVIDAKYEYKYWRRNEFAQSMGRDLGRVINHLNDGWEPVDSGTAGALLAAAGVDFGNDAGVLLRRLVKAQ
jgi:hypothetical protein